MTRKDKIFCIVVLIGLLLLVILNTNAQCIEDDYKRFDHHRDSTQALPERRWFVPTSHQPIDVRPDFKLPKQGEPENWFDRNVNKIGFWTAFTINAVVQYVIIPRHKR
jgi:hypothetical protein